jgi:hypothetical protein
MTVGSGLVFARDQTWRSSCGASAPDRERQGWRVARKHAVAVALGDEPLGRAPEFLGRREGLQHSRGEQPARGCSRAAQRELVQPRRPGRRLAGDSRANLITVTDDPKENENRKDRDQERSDEAHWRVAEEGAEDQDDRAEAEDQKGQEDTRIADS